MNNKKKATSNGENEMKREYKTPKLVKWGTLTDLTEGPSGGNTDQGGFGESFTFF